MTRACVSRETIVKKSILATLLLAQISTSAIAETIPTIVVSASRSAQSEIVTPASITVITRSEIEEHGHRNITELLNARGGIQVRDLFGDGSSATIDMRGFGATAVSNTLVLIDGRRLNNSSDMGTLELSSIDLENVERVEIVQGSSGTLFGNQAVGGVINIITRRPTGFRATIQAEAGDYPGNRLKANIAHQLSNGLAYRLSARKEENDNYRHNSDTDKEDLSLRLDYTLAKGSIFFEHSQFREELSLPGALFADELAASRRQSVADYANDYSRTHTQASRLGLEHDLTDHWRFEGELTYRDNDRDFVSSFRGWPGSKATQDRLVRSINPRLIGSYPMADGELLLTGGMDLEDTEYNLLTSFGPQNLDQEIKAAYLQAVIPLSPQWSTTLGLRHAEVDNRIDTGGAPTNLDDEVTVGSLGITYRPDNHWRLFARADENYRFATVDEHTNPVFGQPVGLDNQTGTSYEAGAEYSGDNYRAKAVVYLLKLEDEISFDASGFSNINLDKTRRRGLILEGQWEPNAAWTLGGSYNYTDPEITSGPFDGNRIPLVARHNGRLFTDVQVAPRWSLFGEALFVSNQVLGSDFGNDFPKISGYGVINTTLRYQTGPWFFSARANNLLDKEYATSGAVGLDAFWVARDAYFPAPERNFWLTTRYQFN